MEGRTVTLLDYFNEAKRLCAEKGFKIFTPSRLYFRAEQQFIAASNDTKAKGVLRIWIHRKTLWIEFLPFYEDRALHKLLESRLGIKVKQRRYHPAMKRFNPVHKMISASEHSEFEMFVPNIRLP